MHRLLSFPRTLWRNRRRVTDSPRLLTYIVSFSCNARCVMCDSWKKPPEDELALSEIERIFHQLPRLDAVRFTGGEPMVRPDLKEIHDLAVRRLRPLWTHITSNGLLSDRLVELCETRDRSVPLHLMISLDGRRETHNEIRGHESAWRKAVETLERLAPRQRELRLRLAVNQTIVGFRGMQDYPKLHTMLKELRVRHHVVMAYETSATYNLTRNLDVAPTQVGEFPSRGRFTRPELERFLDTVEDDLCDLPFPERFAKSFYLRGIRERILDHRPIRTNPSCVALSSHVRLYPNGDVPTCQFNSRTVGNLRHQSFEEIWQGPQAENQRDWVRKCPGCWAECEVLPNAIYSGSLLQRNGGHRATPRAASKTSRSRSVWGESGLAGRSLHSAASATSSKPNGVDASAASTGVIRRSWTS